MRGDDNFDDSTSSDGADRANGSPQQQNSHRRLTSLSYGHRRSTSSGGSLEVLPDGHSLVSAMSHGTTSTSGDYYGTSGGGANCDASDSLFTNAASSCDFTLPTSNKSSAVREKHGISPPLYLEHPTATATAGAAPENPRRAVFGTSVQKRYNAFGLVEPYQIRTRAPHQQQPSSNGDHKNSSCGGNDDDGGRNGRQRRRSQLFHAQQQRPEYESLEINRGSLRDGDGEAMSPLSSPSLGLWPSMRVAASSSGGGSEINVGSANESRTRRNEGEVDPSATTVEGRVAAVAGGLDGFAGDEDEGVHGTRRWLTSAFSPPQQLAESIDAADTDITPITRARQSGTSAIVGGVDGNPVALQLNYVSPLASPNLSSRRPASMRQPRSCCFPPWCGSRTQRRRRSSSMSLTSIMQTSQNSRQGGCKPHETIHAQSLLLGLVFCAIWTPSNMMAPNLTESKSNV